MFDLILFLGFPVNASYLEAVSSIDAQVLKLFIADQPSAHLQEVVYADQRYVGKYVGEIGNLSDLELLQINIYSILKKIIPEYPFEESPLVLFAISKNQ